jgi:RNase H-like protein
MIDGGATLARRLERYRAVTRATVAIDPPGPPRIETRGELAERLAAAMDGEIVTTTEGTIVRCEVPARPIPLDRARLATLPGQAPADVPLVCLDTETTGLATAAGTLAWLIGLGWWEGDQFRQAQLLLPDHADERALLTSLAGLIAPNAWLVTYNGRGFDWPLLVARYRMARRSAPVHAGHLDLLPVVRRLFRHRMENARLRTAESTLLGMRRVGDLEGWEIPSRYLRFLRGGPAEDLVDVVRHNDQDVRSLARLLALLETRLGDAGGRAEAASGDLAGLARAFTREHRLGEALDCLDIAIDRSTDAPPLVQAATHTTRETPRIDDDPWWSPRRPADFGGSPGRRPTMGGPPRTAAFDTPWTTERIAIDRAHLLRRLGRHLEAAEAWQAVAAGTSRSAIIATIELAKLHEHRLRDPASALRAVLRGLSLAERRRRLGMPEPALEADLVRRHERLLRRRFVERRSIA